MSQHPLKLTAGGFFDIMQVADVHYGEAEALVWGPAQDINSTRVLRHVLRSEAPQLVAFTGDQLTGNNIHSNATRYWSRVIQAADESGVPHLAAMGNHDDAPYEGAAVAGPRSTTTARQLMAFEASLSHSVSQLGPANITGASNYFVPVMSATTPRPALFLYVLDSGGGQSTPEGVAADQVAWFASTAASNLARWGAVPSLLFVHIPTPEFALARSRAANRCFGMNENGGVTPAPAPGLVDAAITAGVSAIIVDRKSVV